MDDGIGSLASFRGILQSQFAAGVFHVAHHDYALAPGFGCELVVTSQINCVVEVSSSGVIALRNGAWSDHASATDGIYRSAANGAFEDVGVLGKVSQQIHVKVEADNHDFVQKTRRGVLLGSDYALHAAAGVDQQAERDGHIYFF